MTRRTKIVATLGPATDAPETLDAMIAAGLDVVRLNFSHGNAADHIARAKLVRERAKANRRPVGILVDLQGPKIRTEKFANGPIQLKEGQRFCLDTTLASNAGDEHAVGCTYKALAEDLNAGDVLLLADGQIVLQVTDIQNGRIETRVKLGGPLSDNKGINKQGGGLSSAALTDKDKADIITAAQINADYVAVSFPRNGADMELARSLLTQAGSNAHLLAKIERAEAIPEIDNIMAACDAIMVARGDLGVEIGDAALAGVQKMLIRKARQKAKICITATQMMESMIQNPMPTRAEVLDVANAVMDGSDAVMLSAETAVGKYPVKVIETMSGVCAGAEQVDWSADLNERLDSPSQRIDEAVAMATMYTANHLQAKCIVALTESGRTALWMSRINTSLPIYAMTRHQSTLGKLALYGGVHPLRFTTSHKHHRMIIEDAIEALRLRGAVKPGDVVLVTKGELDGVSGGTNSLKIVEVGEQMFAHG